MGNSNSNQPLIVSKEPLGLEEIDKEFLFGRRSWDTAKMIAEYPSRAQDGLLNKKIVYEIACGTKDHPRQEHQGQLEYPVESSLNFPD
jgi:hypothetical protein